MPQYREFNQQELQEYLEYYDKGEIISFEKINSGLANINYKITTDKGLFLLKLCQEKSIESIEIQLNVLESLKKHLFPSAYPYEVKFQSEKTNKYAVIGNPCALLFEYIPGFTGQKYQVSVEMMKSIGHVCAQLHNIPVSDQFISMKIEFPPSADVKEFLDELKEDMPYFNHPFVNLLKSDFKRLDEIASNPNLPYSYVHGDIFADNCIFDDKGIVNALVDFEEVCYAPSLLDVAMTIIGCCYNEDSYLNEELCTAFLQSYIEVKPLTDIELDLLPDFVDYCSIVSSFWRFRQFNIRYPNLGLNDNYLELLNRSTNKSFTKFYDKIKPNLQRTIKPMTFKSTRGSIKYLSFSESILTGYASDGGLLVPETIPLITKEMLKGFRYGSFVDICKFIISKFIDNDQIPSNVLDDIITNSFKHFEKSEVIPIKKVDDYYILEMFWGPTASFKDLSIGILARIINYLAQKNGKTINILVGTSGDTGSSAIYGCKDLENVNIIVLYPHNRISKIQQTQITNCDSKNVIVYGVDGSSDDLDIPIKNILTDSDFVKKHNICTINSINLGRILMQTVHYFYAYSKLLDLSDISHSTVTFSVPTGACGNISGGFLSKLMGLPIQIISACNENDIIDRAVNTGIFSKRNVVVTSSPAIDIQVPYNWERVCYFASSEDYEGIKEFMGEFYGKGQAIMQDKWLKEIKETLCTASINMKKVDETVLQTYKDHQYLLDPHSAIGVAAFKTLVKNKNTKVVCLATASPHKFPDYLSKVIGKYEDVGSIPRSISEMNEPIEREVVGDLELLEKKVRENIQRYDKNKN